jgi:hypothetical protein
MTLRGITAAVVLGVAATAMVITSAQADTHTPCIRRSAVAPYVSTIDDGIATLSFSGDIGGCPSSTLTEGVRITLHAQHLKDGGWTDAATATYARSWNQYSRFARQTGGTIHATCMVGDWRTLVTGGDGFEPTAWSSEVVTFTPGDSGVCGSYGGGD